MFVLSDSAKSVDVLKTFKTTAINFVSDLKTSVDILFLRYLHMFSFVVCVIVKKTCPYLKMRNADSMDVVSHLRITVVSPKGDIRTANGQADPKLNS